MQYPSQSLKTSLNKCFSETSLVVYKHTNGRFGGAKKLQTEFVSVIADIHKIRYYASVNLGVNPCPLIEAGFEVLKDCSSSSVRKHMAYLDNELHAYKKEIVNKLDVGPIRMLTDTIVRDFRQLLRDAYEKRFFGYRDVCIYMFMEVAGEALTEELVARMKFHSEPLLEDIRKKAEILI